MRNVQQRLRLMAVLDTVEYLRRSGRASAITATLGDLLQLKPLLELASGQIIQLARLRTRQKARDNLAARIQALGALERLAVLHVAVRLHVSNATRSVPKNRRRTSAAAAPSTLCAES